MHKTIKNLMGKEHRRIEFLLEEFEKSLNKDLKKARELFSRFSWNLEKHFYIEEKIIFTIYQSSESENNDLDELLKEHKEIQWEIKKIKENLENNAKIKILKLKTILMAHSKFEDDVFYPRLDENLSQAEKQIIINRAEEEIRA